MEIEGEVKWFGAAVKVRLIWSQPRDSKPCKRSIRNRKRIGKDLIAIHTDKYGKTTTTSLKG